jgi:uncharacterized protein (TIGR03435 family)
VWLIRRIWKTPSTIVKMSRIRNHILLSAAFAYVFMSSVLIKDGLAQATSQTFEVASVKSSEPDDTNSSVDFPPARVSAKNMTLRGLIRLAYNVKGFQVIGGPKWLDSSHFDIEAKTTPTVSIADRRLMLRALLNERFSLGVRRIAREASLYSLEVSSGGSKMRSVNDENFTGFRIGRGQLSAQNATIAALANVLSNWLDRPVVDKTGLIGRYEVHLTWAPEDSESHVEGQAEITDRPGPALFRLIQDQLGLVLRAGKGQMEVIEIESAELPQPN